MSEKNPVIGRGYDDGRKMQPEEIEDLCQQGVRQHGCSRASACW